MQYSKQQSKQKTTCILVTDTVIFSTEASGTFNYTPFPEHFTSNMSRIQTGEWQNSLTSSRKAKWSVSHVLYSQKISELLTKLHSQKGVAPSIQTHIWRTRGREQRDFSLTALSFISGSTWVMSCPPCYRPYCHQLVWRRSWFA